MVRGDRIIERRLAAELGVEKKIRDSKKLYFDDSSPCEACDSVPTTNARLVTYTSLRKIGLTEDWCNDPVFYARLCKSCFQLIRGYRTEWAKDWAKSHRCRYTDARAVREHEWMKVVERLSDHLNNMELAKERYLELVEQIVIKPGDPYPMAENNSVVTSIDVRLKKEGIVIVYVIKSY